MDFLNLSRRRYSLRSFNAKQIAAHALESILEAGRLAPTAVNYQPQRILVVQDKEGMDKIKLCTKFHFNAPTILVICFDSGASWKNRYTHEDAGWLDAAIVTTHMMLEAAELGLGSTFVGDFNAATLREQFKLPAFLQPVALLPLGYPSDTAKPHKLHDQRKPLAETVFYDSFDGLSGSHADEEQHKALL